MSKLGLIIKREYLTRVRSRSFLLSTLLAPLAFVLYIVVVVWISSYQGNDRQHIAVFDQGGVLKEHLPDDRGVRFDYPVNIGLDSLKKAVQAGQYDGVLQIPALANLSVKKQTIFYHSDKQLSPEIGGWIERKVANRIRDFKIDSLHLNRGELETLDTEVAIDPESIADKNNEGSEYTSTIAAIIGGVIGFVMFFMMTFYGQMVMRSVMEEKVSRIVEVMISTVKPFDLMLGKILGAGAVGLTQILCWVVIYTGFAMALPLIAGVDMASVQPPVSGAEAAAQVDPDKIALILHELARQNWWSIISLSIIYFLGGYFIFTSLFAAVGSAIGEDMGQSQSLVFPIMLPIIIALYIMLAAVRNPNSGLAVFASIFPLFSPVVMPARLPFHPPWWQVGLSLVLVILAAFFFVWLAGRIYRVGILLYGKKVTFRELGKWLFYKG